MYRKVVLLSILYSPGNGSCCGEPIAPHETGAGLDYCSWNVGTTLTVVLSEAVAGLEPG